MKSLLALAIFTVVIPGCGTMETATKYNGPTYIAPELREVMDDWVTTCRQHLDSARCDTAGIERIVYSDDLKGNNVIGTCAISVEGFKEVRRVYIRRGLDPYSYLLKAVMLHEMVHCRMGFERHADVGVMGEHIMYDEDELGDKWPELLKDTYSLVK